MTSHNFKMWGLIILAFIIAGIQAIHGMTAFDSFFDAAIPVLLAIEHSINGSTNT